jgi:catechol 2,3-dioxygenase-like lactoylglutathione lyase family enzyme
MIAIQDIAYVRYQAPDLDQMEAFLVDFGLERAARTASTLYMRGCGSAHHVHITEQASVCGTPGFGLLAGSADDLERLAGELGSRVEDSPEPGGGQRVRFTDPAGFQVDVVHGQQQAARLPSREAAAANWHGKATRLGRPIRGSVAPARVMRLGHALLLVPDLATWVDFYQRVLGFKASDTYYAGPAENTVAAFLHCGLGRQWTDHHTLAAAAAQDGRARFDHTAFEVLDLDDLMQGGEHLLRRQYRRSWGIGRHIQGSQLFDYWRDPFGNKIEHWTDGDLVNDDTPVGRAAMVPGELSQWGPPLTPEFFE